MCWAFHWHAKKILLLTLKTVSLRLFDDNYPFRCMPKHVQMANVCIKWFPSHPDREHCQGAEGTLALFSPVGNSGWMNLNKPLSFNVNRPEWGGNTEGKWEIFSLNMWVTHGACLLWVWFPRWRRLGLKVSEDVVVTDVTINRQGGIHIRKCSSALIIVILANKIPYMTSNNTAQG